MRAWTGIESRMLTEMWLCGVASGDIAEVLSRTRNSVMGRIDRMDLMKRKGDGVMPRRLSATTVAIGMAVTFPDVLGRNRRAGHLDDVCAVMLAMVANGRRSRRVAALTGLKVDEVRMIDDALTRTGTWPRMGGPPACWWSGGTTEVKASITAVAMGMMALSAAA